MTAKGLHQRFGAWAAMLAISAACVSCGNKRKPSVDRNHGASPLFARSFGGAETDVANSIAADPRGNVFVCGETRPNKRGMVDPPGQAFLLKYSPQGKFEWSQYHKGWSSAVVVGADKQGNVFVTGRSNPSGGAMSSKKYITKYDGSGNQLWTRTSGGEDMVIDGAGNAAVVGVADGAHGTVDLVLNSKLYVAKISGAGEHTWVKTLRADSDRQRIAVDSAGDVFVAGTFTGTGDFGGGVVSAAGKRDVFIVKRAADDGRHLWSRTYRADQDVSVVGMAATTRGAVVVVLEFHNKLQLGGSALVGKGDTDIAIAAYTVADGTHLWSFRTGGNGPDQVKSVVAGRLGSFILAGSCAGMCEFGDKTIKARDRGDAFVVSYSGKGTLLSAEVFGAANSLDAARGVVGLPDGDFVVTGTYNGDTTKIGARSLTNKGAVDVFVTKLDE